MLKAVWQSYRPSRELQGLMETFRRMVNECIAIGLEENRTSLKSLSLTCYPRLKSYNVGSRYKLCAISRAAGILRNHRKLSKKYRVRIPYCTQPSLVTCYGLRLDGDVLKLPSGFSLKLNRHTLSALEGMDIQSVAISENALSIAYSKDVAPVKITGMLALDRNLDNVTLVDTQGKVEKIDLSNATITKARCRQTKRRFSRNDMRTRRRIYRKYGRIEKHRVGWILHNTSARIVQHARQQHMAIVMENIKGIRRLYRRGNGQNRDYRARMNNWSFYEFQRQVDYKAKWAGLPVHYVSPRGTSAKCSGCGNRLFPEENRQLRCSNCGLVDRDANAARNILSAGLRFSLKGPPVEAMVEEREPSEENLILTVDGGQSS